MSYFAEYEAKKISRRTKAGLERARSEGKKIGRPSKFHQHKDTLIKLQQKGATKAEMKRQTGLTYNTVKTYLKRIDQSD